jgi:hypothetical protein
VFLITYQIGSCHQADGFVGYIHLRARFGALADLNFMEDTTSVASLVYPGRRRSRAGGLVDESIGRQQNMES